MSKQLSWAQTTIWWTDIDIDCRHYLAVILSNQRIITQSRGKGKNLYVTIMCSANHSPAWVKHPPCKKIQVICPSLSQENTNTVRMAYFCRIFSRPVPIGIGIPIIIHSLTPSIWSSRPWTAASKRWSVVFSKDANMSTLSFILAIPKRVIPRTSPCWHTKFSALKLQQTSILHSSSKIFQPYITAVRDSFNWQVE